VHQATRPAAVPVRDDADRQARGGAAAATLLGENIMLFLDKNGEPRRCATAAATVVATRFL
jgi:hypothetical protein